MREWAFTHTLHYNRVMSLAYWSNISNFLVQNEILSKCVEGQGVNFN